MKTRRTIAVPGTVPRGNHRRRPSTWGSGAPWWWFGAPVFAFAYVLLTPRLLPDIVSVPGEMSAALPALRFLIGIVLGVGALITIRLMRWTLSGRT